MTDDYPMRCGYAVRWSDDHGQYIGTCNDFPSLLWACHTQAGALNGIVSLVRQSLEDTARERPQPDPVRERIEQYHGTDWHKLADERSAEIIRLGSLLDDAVELLVAWLPAKDDPLLGEKTALFLALPEVERIVVALNRANWKGPKVLCPACGADYAEAEAKNARFAELQTVRVKVDVPGGGGWTEDMPVPAGSIGTIVHVSPGVPGYHVEFTDDEGKTLRVATLTADALEKVKP